MRSLIPFYIAFVMLAGCVTTPDGGRELTVPPESWSSEPALSAAGSPTPRS